jgi:hypothetical protein
LVGKLAGKRALGRPRQNGKVIMEWMLEKLSGKVWNGCIWLRIGISAGLL